MENIHIKNKKEVEEKIEKIKKGGKEKLHIVSDFDRTISKTFLKENIKFSVTALLRNSDFLTKDYPEKAFELFNKYHPIELDETISEKEKYKKMEEWWQEHEKLIIEKGISKEVIKKVKEKYPEILKKGAKEFFRKINKEKIPLLIFSSGMGDIINSYIKDYKNHNIHLFSNFIEFDKDGKGLRYKGKIIHLMNKAEHKIEDKEYKKLIEKRDNIILLGDAISDLGMVKKKDTETLLTIGFLNSEIKERLEKYKEKFDIVITEDSFDFINKIMDEISE